MAVTAKDLCGALGPINKGYVMSCRRKKSHLKHHSKYQRQHMDSRAHPVEYWEPTEEEIKDAQKES